MIERLPGCPAFEGMKIFSATKARDRETLGDTVTNWMNRHKQYQVVDCKVSQSSDSEFHCVVVALFYTETKRETRHNPSA